jgi:3-oxoacyl-[acyl-carrier-protein] synthase-3
MQRPIARITGTGRYSPAKVLSNADLEVMVDTSDDWIRERTGIRERRITESHETIAYMATEAARQALDEAGLGPEDLDTIVLGTATPDRLLPSTACDLQASLGAVHAAAFDIDAACSGFLYGMTVAEGLMSSGNARNALVVGAERLSTIVNYQDRGTCILFGDGVGVALLQPADNGQGVLSTYMKSDGRLADLLYRPAGGSVRPVDQDVLQDQSHMLHMAGREVFKHAVRSMADACDRALEQAGLSGEDIDILIPHQANIRIIDATAKHAGIPPEKVYVNVDRYGNTSAASIPIALDECVREGRIKSGDIVLLVAFGAGFTWASCAIRW